MYKVAFNNQHGGFGLSEKAVEFLTENIEFERIEYFKSMFSQDKANNDTFKDPEPWTYKDTIKYYFEDKKNRHDPLLIKCIEKLGNDAHEDFDNSSWNLARGRERQSFGIAVLSGNKYIIREYDGKEVVVEPDDIKWIEIAQLNSNDLDWRA